MIVRDSFGYLVTRLGVGILGIAVVSLCSRFATPDTYGQYAVAFANAQGLSAIGFGWLGTYILRMLPEAGAARTRLLSTILIFQGTLTLLMLGVAVIAFSIGWSQGQNAGPGIAGIACLGAFVALFNTSICLSRAQRRILSFSIKSFARILLFGIVGVLLLHWNFGVFALTFSAIISFFLSSVIYIAADFGGVALSKFSSDTLRDILRFGIPLMISAGLMWVVDSCDRIIVYYYLGAKSAGDRKSHV